MMYLCENALGVRTKWACLLAPIGAMSSRQHRTRVPQQVTSFTGKTLEADRLILPADQVTTNEHEPNSCSLLQHFHTAQRFLSHLRKK